MVVRNNWNNLVPLMPFSSDKQICCSISDLEKHKLSFGILKSAHLAVKMDPQKHLYKLDLFSL